MAANGVFDDLRQRFREGNIVRQLIFVNVGVFVLFALCRVLLTLFNLSFPVSEWVALPASVERFLRTPWTVLTYMFLHADVLHLLFNMLWLYWFGALFLRFYSSKHLLGLYFLGGLVGGAVYILSYNVFPYFSSVIHTSFLMGASASVLAVAIATAVKAPNYQVGLFLLGNVRLKYLALFIVVSDLLFITSGNAGGHLAHLGGALSGWAFAYCLERGHDLTALVNKTIDLFGNIFVRRAKPRPKMTAHTYDKHTAENDRRSTPKQQSEEIDRILERLRQSGYGSLSEEEKKKLFDASKR